MNRNPLYYAAITFDPGGAGTGWALFVIDMRAFSSSEEKILNWVYDWDSGCFKGPEHGQIEAAVALFDTAHKWPEAKLDIVSEDFELTQTIGGKNLLSPVRINAVLEWEAAKLGLPLTYQKRQLRTSITRQRLAIWGYEKRWQKDEFAAMQHMFTWLRRLKRRANERPGMFVT